MRRDKNETTAIKIKTERPSVVPATEKVAAPEPKRITRIKKEKADDTSSANSSPDGPTTSRAEAKLNSHKSQKSGVSMRITEQFIVWNKF